MSLEDPELIPVAELGVAPIVVPVAEREPFWGYVDLALVIGLSFFALVATCIPLFFLLKPDIETGRNIVAFGLTSQVILYVAVYAALRAVFTLRYHKAVFRSLGWRGLGIHPGLAALAGVVLAIAVGGLIKLLKVPDVPSPVEELVKSRLTLIGVALIAALAAPVFEEALFRGFLQPLLSRTFGGIAGILITAVLFGFLHLKEYSGVWQYAVAISVVGVAFGIARAQTNSLIPSTIMHAAFNGVSVMALFATKFSHLS